MAPKGSPYAGMQATFAERLRALVAASGGRLRIRSGYRSEQEQAVLWQQALKRYGSPAKARKWVAPPGGSNHGRGIAADLEGDLAWANANGARFGLHFPLGNEPWHVEPIGSRGAEHHQDDGHGAAELDVDSFMAAVEGQESGGDPDVANKRTGAYGRYQIMPQNWPAWAREAGVDPADRSPDSQHRVARFKMEQYRRQFGSWEAVLVAWYAGPKAAAAWVKNPNSTRFTKRQGDGDEPSINEYVRRVMARVGTAPATSAAGGGSTKGGANFTLDGQLAAFADIFENPIPELGAGGDALAAEVPDLEVASA